MKAYSVLGSHHQPSRVEGTVGGITKSRAGKHEEAVERAPVVCGLSFRLIIVLLMRVKAFNAASGALVERLELAIRLCGIDIPFALHSGVSKTRPASDSESGCLMVRRKELTHTKSAHRQI
jgi:hypothetical protein